MLKLLAIAQKVINGMIQDGCFGLKWANMDADVSNMIEIRNGKVIDKQNMGLELDEGVREAFEKSTTIARKYRLLGLILSKAMLLYQ